MVRRLLYIEKVCLLLAGAGWITSIWLWPSSYALFLLGMMGLILLYGGLYWKLSAVKPVIIEIVKGLLVATVLVGIGHRWMMWELNEWVFTGSLVGLLGLIFTPDIRNHFKSRSRVWLVLCIGMIFWFMTPINVVQIKYFQHSEYVEAVKQYYENPSEQNALRVDSLNQRIIKNVVTPED